MKNLRKGLVVITWILLPLSTTARAQEAAGVSLSTPVDINALVKTGQATVSGSTNDAGQVANLFDGRLSTLYISANTNPETILVAFAKPRKLSGFRVHFSHAAGNPAFRWKIEVASNLADLQARAGSYTEAVADTDAADGEYSSIALPQPINAQVVRLTAQRLTGDNFVHIDEWEMTGEITLTKLMVRAAKVTTPQFGRNRFSAIGSDDEGNVQDVTNRVTWASSQARVASIDDKGEVQALNEGRGRITATLGGLSGSRDLVVGPPEARDLDVGFIERTPRYDYDAPKNNPAEGDAVQFEGHIKNWGRPTASAPYQWQLDGRVVAVGTLINLKANEEIVVKWPWQWQNGAHRIGLVVDPQRQIAESSEANNQIEDRTDGISVGLWVEQAVYDFFRAHQRDLGIGSNSWEDWAQRQMARWNEFNRQAIHPLSPRGVEDRVRIDKIVVVPDGALPLHGGLPSNNPDTSDKSVDLMWGFNNSLLSGDFYAATSKIPASGRENAFYFEPSLVHELGHARYLIDHYGFDVANSAQSTQVQIQEGGQPVAGSTLMPFLLNDAVLYPNQFGGVMTGPYGGSQNPWSPYEAAALNRIAGRRAQCGNQNAPCNIGVFLNDLPARNHLKLVDEAGNPLVGARVDVYQTGPGTGNGAYGKTFDNTPDLQLVSDDKGVALLPRNPFAPDQMQMAILRIAHGERVWYRFLEAAQLNMEFWRGQQDDGVITLELPAPDSAPKLEVRGYDRPIANDDAVPSLEDHTDFGRTAISAADAFDGATQAPLGTIRVFVLRNRGGTPLQLQAARISGPHAADFSVVRQVDNRVAAGCITTLQIRFDPRAAGARQAVVSFGSNDPNAPQFRFAVQGEAAR